MCRLKIFSSQIVYSSFHAEMAKQMTVTLKLLNIVDKNAIQEPVWNRRLSFFTVRLF